MGDDFKGFEMNLYNSENIHIYDEIIEKLQMKIELREWDIDVEKECVTIDHYVLRRGADIHDYNRHFFDSIVSIIVAKLVYPFTEVVKDQPTKYGNETTFNDEDVLENIRNYVEWQLDLFVSGIHVVDYSIDQELI